MKNVAVVFWSGTGNTEAMAEAVAKGARAAGASASVIPVGSFDASQIAKFDAFAFGCPAMGSEALEDSEFEPVFDEVKGGLAGKRVAVQLGTSGQALLENDQSALSATFEGGAAVTMENFNICGTELAAGSVDAVVIDLPVAQTLQKKFSGLVILDENLGSEQYGICFRSGDDALCAQVEEGIMKLVEDGTYLSLAEKYGLDPNVLCLLPKAE